MKNSLLILSLFFLLSSLKLSAQTSAGTLEQKLTDSICNCVTKLNIDKIITKDQAVAAYTQCVGKHVDLLQELAAEKHIAMDDQPAMEALGIVLAKNLMKQGCNVFTQLATKMAVDNADTGESPKVITAGTFKRMDTKGFNYIVITANNGTEKSFLWLREFPGSEKLMVPAAKLLGKKLKITWQEMEVYLPSAKGYYKVKEITGLELL